MEKHQRLKKLERNGLFCFCREMVERYRDHDIPRQGAALSYYLLFTLFPLLIFVSSLLGILQLDVERVLDALNTVLPSAVVELCGMYLKYVSQTADNTMLWFSLVFSIYFPMRSANSLMRGVRMAYGLDRPSNIILYYIRLLLYTVFLIVLVAVALVLTTVGGRVLLYITSRLSVPLYLIRLWHYLRFAVLAVVLFAIFGLLYVLAQDRPQTARGIVPGTLIAMVSWMVLSLGFSYYVENFANYTVIYGTLGAVIILLIWLYLSSVTLLLGAEFNAVLLERKEQKKNASNGGSSE